MADLCDDGRFELIEKYKLMLMESTNISDSEDELKVLDTILFRFWQMGWLGKLEQPTAQPEQPERPSGREVYQAGYAEGYKAGQEERKKMSNKEWVDFLSEQFNVSRTSAREMLHGLMRWKAEDNFKKQFSGGMNA